MATASWTALSLSSTSTLIDGKAPPPQSAAASSQCVTLPNLPPPPLQHHNRTWKTTDYCRKIARNVVTMATGEAPAEVAAATELPELRERPELPELPELPDIIKPLQEAWDKVEEKYAVSSLAVAVVFALYASAGIIWAIDKLPIVPGILELVGIGYTSWFAYKNLIFKPEREALIEKIKCTYSDIIGSS